MSVLFVLASCQKENNSYYVDEIIRLETQVHQAEIERDLYKSKLEKYESGDIVEVNNDSIPKMSLTSIQTYARFYPN